MEKETTKREMGVKEMSVFKGAIRDFLDGLMFMKKILGWRETWIPTLTVAGWVLYMLVISFAHSLPNPWRSIIIWGMIFGLVIVAPGVMFLSERKQ